MSARVMGRGILRTGFRAATLGLIPAALLSLCSPAAAADAQRLPVSRLDARTLSERADGREMAAREQERLQQIEQRHDLERQLLGPHQSSRKSLTRLSRTGLGPQRLAGFAEAPAPAAARTDTVKVLMVRIGFQTDRSGDLTSVTTDGDFLLQPDPELKIDPAPHDRAFFESHLRGLHEYYWNQSGGRLFISGKVLPEGDTDCYKLSDVADFGPGASGMWTLKMLEGLVRRIIAVADSSTIADGAANLAEFDDDNQDAYVIFIHSGADWQSDVNADSGNDIPSFFVQLGEPEPLASIDGGTGSAGAMSECSIIPETTSQDGYLGSIAGVLYHEFGHALGLPDVYDTSTGLTAAGVWDLMDTGPNVSGVIGVPVVENPDPGNPDDYEVVVASGILPPSLSAWCKWFLGWLDFETVSGAEAHFRMPAVQIPRSEYPEYSGSSIGGTPFGFDPADPQAVIGGVSPREFFLVENRWVPWGPEDFPDAGGVGMLRDPDTGVLLYLAGDDNRNTGMYDYFLYGGGLLVWHVDAAAIADGWDDNSINSTGSGLRLVEADGITDVGFYDPFAVGIYGSAGDPFHAGTSDHLDQEGVPSTRAVDRSWTGFAMRDISAELPTMEFEAAVSPLASPPARELPPLDVAGGKAPRLLDVDSSTPFPLGEAKAGDAGTIVFAEDPAPGETCHLFALTADGAEVVPAPAGWPVGSFARLDRPLAGPPAVFSTAGGERLLVGTTDGAIRVFGTAAPAAPDPIWTAEAADTLAFAPVVCETDAGDPILLACCEPGRVVLLDADGGRALDLTLSPAGDFTAPPLPVRSADGRITSCVLFMSDFWLVFDPQSALDGGAYQPLPVAIEIDPVAGDVGFRAALLPADEGNRLVVFGDGGDNRSWIIDGAASPEGRWTEAVSASPAGEIAVADVDADGRPDVLVATAGALHVLSAGGGPLTGWPFRASERFPLPADTGFTGSVCVFDGDGDSINEVYAVSDAGHLFGFDARGGMLERTPFLWGAAGDASLCVSSAGIEGDNVMWLAGAGDWNAAFPGEEGDNGRMVGYLPPAAGLAAAATGRWLGPGGGPARTGMVGEAADLGSASPAAEQVGRFFAYPNPAVDDHVTFRFNPEFDAEAGLAIYNLEGELVMRAGMSATAGVDNEYRWALGDLASGVYLCRLTLRGEGESASRMLRLAVER